MGQLGGMKEKPNTLVAIPTTMKTFEMQPLRSPFTIKLRLDRSQETTSTVCMPLHFPKVVGTAPLAHSPGPKADTART